ncbi:Translin [Dentipellis sp. KUC8613]|nr:Translin [Dentipellis sp. KUC8613]
MDDDPSSIPVLFDAFRAELDDHNDRRERLIKASRDVTIASKRVIFLLHRIINENTADYAVLATRAAAEASKKLREIQGLFKAMAPELAGDRFWHYQPNVSPGLQEYIEALSFAHYLEHRSLITYAAVQRSLSDDVGGPYFPLPVSDYLLGLSDLTGELMRFAISAIAKRGGRSKASEVCAFVRGCKADFEIFTPHIRDLAKKQRVTSQSLQKIEEAAYAIAVRTSEYDLPPDLLDDLVSRHVSGYRPDEGDERRGAGRKRHHESDDEGY